MEKQEVISKWGVKGSRILETDLEYDVLLSLIAECVESTAPEKAQHLKSVFGEDDSLTIAENMISENAIEALAILSILEESEELDEVLVKRVNAAGTVTRIHDRETRKRRATQTTGLSKSQRRQIARHAVKTKRANPSIQIRANKKYKKAMRKRHSMGL
ncbi:essential prohead core protein [Aeromonas phage AS-zj]|uniref:Prohead core protein n=4 Tax=Caudoviricetes TaxID=2731619 RepID=A0A411B8B6_9CAUD|nr:head scaffolding protein [Aeromonas phage AS-zj]YP_009834917.1 head scaffolding protein [Aeromonas phage AS-sw]QAX97866.1 prohead core protein [Aeromonas phage Asswx_1]QAX99083.1 prohead core protein [Aeromonas phage Assk]UKM62494.1 putative prohead core protein [Aeromonas phage P19]ASU00169.1 essential prohead core protein [Aeromonas phage AS-zj]ATI18265.1 essential prohead core protein [Aeromonas phage AS-sw]